MKLSAPTTLVFVIALVVAVIAALQALGSVSIIPVASVWLMGVGYAVLAVGCLIKGV